MKISSTKFNKTGAASITSNRLKFQVILFLGFILSATSIQAGHGRRLKFDSTSCLLIEGKILNADQGIDESCVVELILNNSTVDSVLLKNGKSNFKFVLSKNKNYAIRISKRGFVSKLLSIDTRMLNEEEVIFKFEFAPKLVKVEFAKKLNQDALDWPVALINFDGKHQCFSYDRQYTTQMKRNLYASNN